MKAPAGLVGTAFVGIVLLGGFNGTAIALSSVEVPPFFGGLIRFGLAGLIFFAIVIVRRVALPRGRQLAGSLIYGVVGFGVVFGLVYWALPQTGAGIGQVVLALAPLLTLLLAAGQGLERFRAQSLFGAVIAVAGIALVFLERMTGEIVTLALAGLLLADLAIAEANVAIKLFPRSHPLSNNAVAMSVAAVLLGALSLLTGERWSVPQQPASLLGMGYLVVVGSVIVFTLYLYVIERWTASATTYSFLLMPLPAVVFAALLLNEPITPALVVGGALVLVGVYVGAFAPAIGRSIAPIRRRPIAARGDGPPTLASPNCP